MYIDLHNVHGLKILPDKKLPTKYYEASCVLTSEYSSVIQAVDEDDAKRKIQALAKLGKLEVKNSSLKYASAKFSYQNDFAVGSLVVHKKFGVGEILDIEGSGQQSRILIKFNSDNKQKWLVASYANLKNVGSNYHNWLQSQCDRDDWVSDLAHDIFRDKSFPMGSDDLEVIKSYLLGNGAHSGVIDAFNASWLEYKEAMI